MRSMNRHGYRNPEKFATALRGKKLYVLKKINLSSKNKYTASYNGCDSYIGYIFASGLLPKLIY